MMDFATVELASAAVASAAGAAAYAVRGRSSSLFAPSVYRGDPEQPLIALTFDDGPSRSTPALLEILADHGVPATFFMCGRNVRRFPVIAQEVRIAGHEIGNHSDNHSYLHFKTPEYIFRDLAIAQQTIRATTGVRPRWFRAPYGVRWFGLRSAQQRLGLTGVMWTVIANDWKWPGCRVARMMAQRARNGTIYCLHDGRGLRPSPDIRSTLEAVDMVIPKLQSQGYRFVTLTEMLCRDSSMNA
ncbi:MAG: polysaccharide deacetylase family protein [Acidobacteriota bacterium]